MSEQRFVVQEDANTDKIILLIDYKRMKMYSFLAEEREAVNKICNYLNWFDECTHNYAVMLKEVEESNCEKSKEIAKLKREIGEQQATIKQLEEDKAIAEDYANIFEKENVKLRKKLNNYKATVLGFVWIMEQNGKITGKDDDFVKDLFKLIDDE